MTPAKIAAFTLCCVASIGCSHSLDERVRFRCRAPSVSSSQLAINDWKIEKSNILTSECRRSPDSSSDEWYVVVRLDKDGSSLLESLTRENIGRTIDISIDGIIRSAPVVQTPITKGRILVMDEFSEAGACRLAESFTPEC